MWILMRSPSQPSTDVPTSTPRTHRLMHTLDGVPSASMGSAQENIWPPGWWPPDRLSRLKPRVVSGASDPVPDACWHLPGRLQPESFQHRLSPPSSSTDQVQTPDPTVEPRCVISNVRCPSHAVRAYSVLRAWDCLVIWVAIVAVQNVAGSERV